MKISSFKIVIGVVLVLLLPVHKIYAASHGSISGVLELVTVKETGNVIIKFESAHADPMECGNAREGMIENSNSNKQQFLSLILAGYMAKQTQSFWVTGCISQYGRQYPRITTTAIFQE